MLLVTLAGAFRLKADFKSVTKLECGGKHVILALIELLCSKLI